MPERIRNPGEPHIEVDEPAAMRKRGPLLLLFTADPSALDHEQLDAIREEIASRHQRQLDLAGRDPDEQTRADPPREDGAASIPTLLLFVPGRDVDQLVGVHAVARIDQRLAEQLGAAADPQPSSRATRPIAASYDPAQGEDRSDPDAGS